jgi:hypothetical protein
LPCPLSPGQVQHSTPTLLSVLDYSLLFMFCSYVGSSVLNAALCLWRSALGSTTSAVLGGSLSPSSCSQPLLPYPCLFTESFVLRVWLLAPPLSPGQFPDSPPAPTIGVRLQFAVYELQFCWGVSVCPGAALVYVSRGWVGKSCVVHDAHMFICQITHR